MTTTPRGRLHVTDDPMGGPVITCATHPDQQAVRSHVRYAFTCPVDGEVLATDETLHALAQLPGAGAVGLLRVPR